MTGAALRRAVARTRATPPAAMLAGAAPALRTLSIRITSSASTSGTPRRSAIPAWSSITANTLSEPREQST